MADKKITTIIFDLGKVLIDFDHLRAAQQLTAQTKKTPEQMYKMFFDSKLTRMFEEGKVEPKAFYGKVRSRLRLKMRYEEFVPVWNGIFFITDQNRAVCELARGLKARYTLAILSNVNALHLEYIRENYPIFDAFHQVLASCELGCMKPDSRIYSLALKALNARPGETFYTDDRPELIDKARNMGFRAYAYTGYEQLLKDLARCGIEVPA